MSQYFESVEELRRSAGDLSRLPARSVVTAVEQLLQEIHKKDMEDDPYGLNNDSCLADNSVTPEMLEACVAQLYDKKFMEEVAQSLDELAAHFIDPASGEFDTLSFVHECVMDDSYQREIGTSKTEPEPYGRALTLFSVLRTKQNVSRFMEQAKRRMSMN